MAKVVKWDNVQNNGFTFREEQNQDTFYVYKLTRIPNFSEPRFSYLSHDVDRRPMEVLNKQLQMIRQLHTMGDDWRFSFRLVKKEKCMIYLVCRKVGPSRDGMDQDRNIQQILMKNEYSFERDLTRDALDIDWAVQAAEIVKEEKTYKGTAYPPMVAMPPQSFYSSYLWAQADNSMEYICSYLMNYSGNAAVEITIAPSRMIPEEKNWLNTGISRLKDAISGETLRDSSGKVLWKGDPVPGLKVPLENFEKLDKLYESSRVFLTSIRVFAESDIRSLAGAFLINCVKNEGEIICGNEYGTEYLKQGYAGVEITPRLVSRYWQQIDDDTPFRAQRLCRLACVEEVSNFFRLPISIRSGFPGFDLDTGMGAGGKSGKTARSTIRIGTYLDEEGVVQDAAFDVQQFAKHGLMVGVPGSGKTTAMFNILYQFWAVPEEKRIPFIVLEPAKTEYRALKTLPEFKEDLRVFTLGDEMVSPFRFNPMEVMPGIKLEAHISRLMACFLGAFNFFNPLPMFLEQAVRRTYRLKGWFDDSVGGEKGCINPTLSDLCESAEYIVKHAGFDAKVEGDLRASLLTRLNALRRGSLGRMLDTRKSIAVEELMESPVVLELDSLNADHKTLMMMFLLSYVFEYCKAYRKSGSPLKHMLLVEEAHNLIGAGGAHSDQGVNPKAHTLELFVNMLAEMRALGQGILIADQLPTAIAPQAVKQTNVKILMRETAKDDREEIGNTMDLNEEQMHRVVNFKTGHAYLYHEGEDHVRLIRMVNFKGEHNVEEPPSDAELKEMMWSYEEEHPELYLPFPECREICRHCSHRTRNQAEVFVEDQLINSKSDLYEQIFVADATRPQMRENVGLCELFSLVSEDKEKQLEERYGVKPVNFLPCAYVHLLHHSKSQMARCSKDCKKCTCSKQKWSEYVEYYKKEEGNGGK